MMSFPWQCRFAALQSAPAGPSPWQAPLLAPSPALLLLRTSRLPPALPPVLLRQPWSQGWPVLLSWLRQPWSQRWPALLSWLVQGLPLFPGPFWPARWRAPKKSDRDAAVSEQETCAQPHIWNTDQVQKSEELQPARKIPQSAPPPIAHARPLATITSGAPPLAPPLVCAHRPSRTFAQSLHCALPA